MEQEGTCDFKGVLHWEKRQIFFGDSGDSVFFSEPEKKQKFCWYSGDSVFLELEKNQIFFGNLGSENNKAFLGTQKMC